MKVRRPREQSREMPAVKALVSAAAVAVLTLAALPASAAENIRRIGQFDAWNAYTYTQDGNKVCYMASQPTETEGAYDERGKVYAMVTHRPAKGARDVVSFVIGYPFKEDSRVTVTIDGGKDFTLFTHKDTAWAADAETEDEMVTTMIQGGEMVVEGTSNKGTKTTDTYSLIGFTDAHQAIDDACDME